MFNLKSEIRNLKSPRGIHPEQYLAVLDRLRVLDDDLGDDAGTIRGDLVVQLHGLDLADDRRGGDARADADVLLGVGIRLGVKGAGGWALDFGESLAGLGPLFPAAPPA